jgi:hypothetical protein
MDNHIRIKTIEVVSGVPGIVERSYKMDGKSKLREKLEAVRNAWASLHDGSVSTIEQLTEWELLIPQYGCSCKRFYAEWKASNPPDFTSPEAFFAWGVNLHNAVNAKLGKPEITIEEALSIWRKSDGLEVKADIEQRP